MSLAEEISTAVFTFHMKKSNVTIVPYTGKLEH